MEILAYQNVGNVPLMLPKAGLNGTNYFTGEEFM